MARNTSVGEVEEKTTCGPLYSQVLSLFTSLTSNPVELFAAGFMAGEAEKIYLGACSAAMFRPSKEYRAWLLKVAVHLTTIYNLEISVFEREEIEDEIWIHTHDVRHQVGDLSHIEYNSRRWHILRGRLCGVPPSQIDCEFHLRKGFGEPCDCVTGG